MSTPFELSSASSSVRYFATELVQALLDSDNLHAAGIEHRRLYYDLIETEIVKIGSESEVCLIPIESFGQFDKQQYELYRRLQSVDGTAVRLRCAIFAQMIWSAQLSSGSSEWLRPAVLTAMSSDCISLRPVSDRILFCSACLSYSVAHSTQGTLPQRAAAHIAALQSQSYMLSRVADSASSLCRALLPTSPSVPPIPLIDHDSVFAHTLDGAIQDGSIGAIVSTQLALSRIHSVAALWHT